MTRLLVRLLINAAALWAAAQLVSGIHLSDRMMSVLGVALVFGLVNTFIKPVLKFFSFPLVFLTLGLFTLVINALMLSLTAALTSSLAVEGFWAAVFGSIVISFVSMLLGGLVEDPKKR